MKPKYKWLQLRNVWTGEEVDGSWDEAIPDGWYKAFGEQMIDELNEILVEHDYADKYMIVQIKEKYGQLRVYDNGVSESASLKHYQWLEKYEVLSEETCIKCGDKATHITKGWIVPLCDECGKAN